MLKKQKNLDKKIIVKVNKKRIPSWKQIKQLPKTINRKEKLVIKILMILIIVSAGYLFYTQYYLKLSTVPADGGELIEGLIGKPDYINPIFAQTHVDAEQDITHLVFSGLLKYNQNLEIIPDLAERYEISEDQLSYTFYLRQDVKWHDGEKFTANDVVFTIQSIQNPDYKSPLIRSFAGVTVNAVDEYTVKFTLIEPYAAFLNVLTVGIIPQHIWFEIPADSAKLAQTNEKPIGTGPFKFKSYVVDNLGTIQVYNLEKNQDYYAQKPHIDKIVFKFYPDYENAINALINKEIHSLGFLPKDYLSKFANKWELNVYNINLSQYTAVFFNDQQNELLKSKKLRQALSYAINKNQIIEEVLQNQGQAIDGPILPGFLGYNPEITKYEYNPEKAVEILASDGWKLDEEEEILKKEDQELVLILTTVEQTEKIQAATLITEYWNNLGIKTQLQIVSKENIENDIINPRNYQLLLYGEIIGYDPDLFPFWHSSQREHPGVNLANYVNRKADLLLEDARKTNDQTVRSEKYQEFQNILLEDLPAIFLYSPTYTYPVNTKIQGIEINRIAKPYDRFINLADWYLKTKKKFFN